MSAFGQKRTLAMLPSLRRLLPSVTIAERQFIAGLDYGQGVERHDEELRKVLGPQDAVLVDGQIFFPYEVIELGAHHLTPGHEREFALCTLLVLNAVSSGFDTGTDLSDKFNIMASAYDELPAALREAVLAGYSETKIG